VGQDTTKHIYTSCIWLYIIVSKIEIMTVLFTFPLSFRAVIYVCESQFSQNMNVLLSNQLYLYLCDPLKIIEIYSLHMHAIHIGNNVLFSNFFVNHRNIKLNGCRCRVTPSASPCLHANGGSHIPFIRLMWRLICNQLVLYRRQEKQ
jgi:hypothetical protein